MKKLLAMILVLAMALSVTVVAFAEESEQTESQFEKVLLQKGSLIIKEFVTYGKVCGMTFQTAKLIDVETGNTVYALRIETSYYYSQYDNGTAVGVLDAAEIDGAIATLEYIKAHISELKDYSEIQYTANSGMVFGAYHSADSDSLFIKVTSKATKYPKVSQIDELIEGLKGVKATFGN